MTSIVNSILGSVEPSRFFFLTLEELGGSRKRPSPWRGVMNMMRFVSRFRTELLLYSSSCSCFPYFLFCSINKIECEGCGHYKAPQSRVKCCKWRKSKEKTSTPHQPETKRLHTLVVDRWSQLIRVLILICWVTPVIWLTFEKNKIKIVMQHKDFRKALYQLFSCTNTNCIAEGQLHFNKHINSDDA